MVANVTLVVFFLSCVLKEQLTSGFYHVTKLQLLHPESRVSRALVNRQTVLFFFFFKNQRAFFSAVVYMVARPYPPLFQSLTHKECLFSMPINQLW